MHRNFAVLLSCFALALTLPVGASADGTETLGAPAIALEAGSGIASGGIGLHNATRSGILSVDVPAGATVQQVLLYWSGEFDNDFPDDDSIVVEGFPITGDRIGGPTFFFNFQGQIEVSAYRADITLLGLVGPGANDLFVEDLEYPVPGFTQGVGNHGAGILVIFDDGSAADLQLRDGVDLAFCRFPAPRDAMVPQTFGFAADAADRSAEISMFFGSEGSEDRPHSIVIADDLGNVDVLANPLVGNSNGDLFTALTVPVTIPAGATELSIEARSLGADDSCSSANASLVWIAAGLELESPADCGDGEVDPGEECDDGNDDNDDACRNDCTEPRCGDGILDGGEQCDDGNNQDGDGCSAFCEAECNLDVQKFCSVPPPARSGNDCKGKVLSARFEYTGGSCDDSANAQSKDTCAGDPAGASDVDIVLTKDADKIGASPDADIAVGDEVTFAKNDASNLPSELKFDIRKDGSTLQSLAIHTSCSQPLSVGESFGGMRLVELSTTEGGTTGLPAAPELAEECEVVARDTGDCSDGKPRALVFRYLGDSCAEGVNQQVKDSCQGDPGDGAPVSIAITKDADEISASPSSGIGIGDLVTISTSKDRFPSELKLNVLGGAQTQSLAIHTSCSDVLLVGDQFGSLRLEDYVPEGGSLADGRVDYTYLVSHNGLGDVIVDVEDDKLGLIADNLLVPEGTLVELMETAFLTETTTNTVVVTDVSVPAVCSDASDAVTVTAVVPPASCADGKPVRLGFEYTGGSCADSANSQEKDSCTGDAAGETGVDFVITKDGDKISADPSLSVLLGEVVSFSRNDGSRLPSELKVDVRKNGNTLQSLTIHTSCSDDLIVGEQFGSLILREFVPEP